MEALALIAITNGAIEILKTTLPEIEKRVQAKEITKEQQQATLDELNGLRDPENYKGPEFQPSGR